MFLLFLTFLLLFHIFSMNIRKEMFILWGHNDYYYYYYYYYLKYSLWLLRGLAVQPIHVENFEREQNDESHLNIILLSLGHHCFLVFILFPIFLNTFHSYAIISIF